MDYVLTDPNIVKVMYADRQYKQVLGVQYRIELSTRWHDPQLRTYLQTSLR